MFTAILVWSLFAGTPVPAPPPDASSSRRGLMSVGPQSFSGVKTFLDGGIIADLQPGSTYAGLPLVGYAGAGVVTATVATLNLFVDALGNDSNPCTSPGVDACATISGALTKVPLVIYSPVLITVAPGTYATAITWLPFTFGPSGTLTIAGSRANSTLASGSATGTVTSFTGSSFSVDMTLRPTIVDSGQTWTANDLRGRFVEILTGSGAGNVYPISGNTATSLTIAGTGSTGAGATYAIREPTVNITTLLSIAGQNASGGLFFQDLDFTGAGVRVSHSSIGTLTMTRCRATNTLGGATVQSSGRFTLTNSVVKNTGNGNAVSIPSSAGNAYFSMSSSFLFAAAPGASQGALVISSKGYSPLLTGDIYIGSGVGIQVSSGGQIAVGSLSVGGVRVECGGSGTALSLGLNSVGSTNSISEPGMAFFNLGTLNCSTGVSVLNGSRFSGATLVVNTSTNGVVLSGASLANLANALPTFTGVTNEYVVDGAAQTSASVEALSPKVVQGVLKSVLLRQ